MVRVYQVEIREGVLPEEGAMGTLTLALYHLLDWFMEVRGPRPPNFLRQQHPVLRTWNSQRSFKVNLKASSATGVPGHVWLLQDMSGMISFRLDDISPVP